MALLAEYALTHDVFDTTSYSSEEVCNLHIQILKDVLLHEGLVRNLRAGGWAQVFSSAPRSWHNRGKELLKKLVTQKRLVLFAPSSLGNPNTDSEWCDEALDTHRNTALRGIIVTSKIYDQYRAHTIIASIERLDAASWWSARSESLRLSRTLLAYLEASALVLRHANSIMLIDAHIHRSLPKYRDFISLVQAAGGRSPRPLIEIHRVCYHGSGQSRTFPDLNSLEAEFRYELSEPLRNVGLSVEVFIWDDFHDRFLISDLVGISMQNGFDTTSRPVKTTWNRLSRKDRDDVQREFYPGAGFHTLRRRFSVP